MILCHNVLLLSGPFSRPIECYSFEQLGLHVQKQKLVTVCITLRTYIESYSDGPDCSDDMS